MQIQDIIDKSLEKREDKEIVSWHPSKLGYCLKGVYFERLGIPPLEEFDARLLRVFKCGNLFEEFIVEQVKAAGVAKEVKEQVRVESKELNVSGYIDIVLVFEEGEMPFEVKSQNSRAFWYMVGDPKKGRAGEGAYPHHKMQLLVYMYINGYKLAKIAYVSKDDLCIQEYVVDIADPLMQVTLDRIAILNKAWEEQVPPEVFSYNPAMDKYCRWHKYCTGELPLPV